MRRVFLDENVDPALGLALAEHFVIESIQSKGWFGVSNGELLGRIEGVFDVLVTHDRGLEHQQNWLVRRLGLVVLCVPSNEFEQYAVVLPSLISTIATTQIGNVVHVDLA